LRIHLKWLSTIGLVATTAVALASQSRPQFEVASVRPSPNPPTGQAGLQITPGQAKFSSLSVKDYIGIAYTVRIHQIIGADWLGNERFEVMAKLPATFTSDQLPLMLQSLLEERFKMRSHREQRELPVYFLEVAPGGPKLTRSEELSAADPVTTITSTNTGGGNIVDLGRGSTLALGNNRFEAKKVTMTMLADVLARFVDRPVQDMTRIEGRYDVAFELTPEDFRAMMMRSALAAGVSLPPEALKLVESSSLAAVPDALKGLGLSLQPRRAPLEVLVVDSIEKTPTEN